MQLLPVPSICSILVLKIFYDKYQKIWISWIFYGNWHTQLIKLLFWIFLRSWGILLTNLLFKCIRFDSFSVNLLIEINHSLRVVYWLLGKRHYAVTTKFIRNLNPWKTYTPFDLCDRCMWNCGNHHILSYPQKVQDILIKCCANEKSKCKYSDWKKIFNNLKDKIFVRKSGGHHFWSVFYE